MAKIYQPENKQLKQLNKLKLIDVKSTFDQGKPEDKAVLHQFLFIYGEMYDKDDKRIMGYHDAANAEKLHLKIQSEFVQREISHKTRLKAYSVKIGHEKTENVLKEIGYTPISDGTDNKNKDSYLDVTEAAQKYFDKAVKKDEDPNFKNNWNHIFDKQEMNKSFVKCEMTVKRAEVIVSETTDSTTGTTSLTETKTERNVKEVITFCHPDVKSNFPEATPLPSSPYSEAGNYKVPLSAKEYSVKDKDNVVTYSYFDAGSYVKNNEGFFWTYKAYPSDLKKTPKLYYKQTESGDKKIYEWKKKKSATSSDQWELGNPPISKLALAGIEVKEYRDEISGNIHYSHQNKNNTQTLFSQFVDWSGSSPLEIQKSTYLRTPTETVEAYGGGNVPFTGAIISDKDIPHAGIEAQSFSDGLNTIINSQRELDIDEITIENHNTGSIDKQYSQYTIDSDTVSTLLSQFKRIHFKNVDIIVQFPSGSYKLEELTFTDCTIYCNDVNFTVDVASFENCTLLSSEKPQEKSFINMEVNKSFSMSGVQWKSPIMFGIRRKTESRKDYENSEVVLFDIDINLKYFGAVDRVGALINITGFNSVTCNTLKNNAVAKGIRLLRIKDAKDVNILNYSRPSQFDIANREIIDILFDNCFNITIQNCTIKNETYSNLAVFNVVNPPGVQNFLSILDSSVEKSTAIAIGNGQVIVASVLNSEFKTCPKIFSFKSGQSGIDSLTYHNTKIANIFEPKFVANVLIMRNNTEITSGKNIRIEAQKSLTLDGIEIRLPLVDLDIVTKTFNSKMSIVNSFIQNHSITIGADMSYFNDPKKNQVSLNNSTIDCRYLDFDYLESASMDTFNITASSLWFKNIQKLNVSNGHIVFKLSGDKLLFSDIANISQFSSKLEQRTSEPCKIEFDDCRKGNISIDHMTLKATNSSAQMNIRCQKSPVRCSILNSVSQSVIVFSSIDSRTSGIIYKSNKDDISITANTGCKDFWMMKRFSDLTGFSERNIGKNDQDIVFYGLIQ